MQEHTALEALLAALEASAFSGFFRQSIWIYPVIEIVHIGGFVVLVGSAIMYDLRLLGFSRRLPVREATAHLIRWSRLSLLAVLPSGFILFAVSAASIGANPAFQLKLLLITLAALNATIYHRFTYRGVELWNVNTPSPASARAAGLISILLWTGVIACGRLIAYV